tara:strand:- start:8397 stop:9458 length:1062 start_codon:yes stop_codon:yes gene_type:complete
MSTNYHKDLPDNQIHNPKGFVRGHTDSVCIKDASGDLRWLAKGYSQKTEITTTEDVTGLLGGKYFLFKTKNNNYQVWIDVDNTDTVVIGPGYTSVEVDIASGDTANTVATNIKTALDALSDVSASVASNKVTMTITSENKCYPPVNTYDITTGFKFVNTEVTNTNEYLTTDSSGNIEWIPKPAVVTNTNYFYHHIGGACIPKGSAIAQYLCDSRGAGTKLSFSSTIGASMPSSILPHKITGYGAFIAPQNCLLGSVQYSISHTSATAHANVEMHLMKVTPSTGTSAKTLSWMGGVTAIATTFPVVDNEVKFGHFAMGNPSDVQLTQGDIIIPILKTDQAIEHHFSMGLHLVYL